MAYHTSMIDFIVLEQMIALLLLCRSILDGLVSVNCQNWHLNYILIVNKL